MVLKLISATPVLAIFQAFSGAKEKTLKVDRGGDSSPYARKIRIALSEKNIPYELVNKVPWNSTTKTPQWNPLEKLRVLINEMGNPVYESYYILEWLEAHHPPPNHPALYPMVKERELFAKGGREEESEVDGEVVEESGGGLKELSRAVGEKNFIVNDRFSVADVAAGCVLGFLKARLPESDWEGRYGNLKRYQERLEGREILRGSTPVAQTISDKVV